MKAGAFGFSADKNLEDRTEDGSALPSHVASPEEFLALSDVLAEFSVGHLGWTIGISTTALEQQRLLTEMMRRSGRPLHVAVGDDEQGFAWAQEAREAGLPVVVQQNSMDPVAEFTLAEYNMFDYMPHWIQPLVGTPEERAAKLRDPAARQAMKQDVEKFPHARTDWHTMIVVQVIQERNRPYEGLTLAELGQKQGKHPLDAFLDLALDDGLETTFSHMLGQSRRRDPGPPHHQPLLPHLPLRWRCPHSLPHHQHLARAFPFLLGARQAAPEPRAGPL